MLAAAEVGMYGSSGGLEARGFLAPALAAKLWALPTVSERLRFREDVEEDRENLEYSKPPWRGPTGDDVPSLTTIGLEDRSGSGRCSVLDEFAKRTMFGLEELS